MQDGTKTATCGRCSETDTVADTDSKLGHNFGAWTVTKEPTLTSSGELLRRCTRDASHTETDTLPALDKSSYTFNHVKDSSCTVNGEDNYVCTIDGNDFTFTVTLEKESHSFAKVEGTPATCVVTGLTDGESCSVCGLVSVAQQTIPLLEHNYSVTTWKCTVCDKDEYNEYSSYGDYSKDCTVKESNGVITLLYNNAQKAGLNLNLFALEGSKTYVFEFGSKATNVKISSNGSAYGNVRIVVDSGNAEFTLILNNVNIQNFNTVLTSGAQVLNLGFYGTRCSLSTAKGTTGSAGKSYNAAQIGNGEPGGNGGNANIAVVCSGKLNIVCGATAIIKGGDGGTGGAGGNSASSGSTGGKGGNGGNGAMAIKADQINVTFVSEKTKSDITISGGAGGSGGKGGYGSALFGFGKKYADDGQGGSSAKATNVDVQYN